MPWGGSPHTDAADAVRALVGDMDAASPRLADNVYTMIIAEEPRLYARAALAAQALAGKYAAEMNRRVGDLWREAKVLFEHYEALSQRYWQASARRSKGLVFVGGLDKTDVETRTEDADQVQPNFKVGMQDSAYLSPDDDEEE